MGIQINGQTDIISATDGSLEVDGFVFKNKTTAERNAGVSTALGTAIYNSTTNQLEIYSGPNGWAVASKVEFQATGGTKNTTSRSGYAVHTFTSPGTFTVINDVIPNTGVEFLVVGGGGAGGYSEAGGGGAGGLVYKTGHTLNAGDTFPVTVGAGGSRITAQGDSNPGNDSSAGTLMTGKGGGAGGTYSGPTPNQYGQSGGSGGGAGHNAGSNYGTATQPSQPGDSGTFGSGNPGGTGAGSGNDKGSGGGGGASAAGGNGSPSAGGAGGNGSPYSITGSDTSYAGGGGGGRYDGSGGSGGSGGGGPAGNGGTDGTANTGGGGGGTNGSTFGPAGSGGSGIVIIAYPTA